MSDVVLRVQGITRSFVDADARVDVLRGVDLELRRGECVALVGASGSGKSTLLHILGGLDQPTTGTVQAAGRAWTQMSESERSAHRNQQLGFVYQFHHLLAEFTAQENVAMPLFIRRVPVGQAQARAAQVLDAVGLAHRLGHSPGELSGGERQRVAVARALVTQPACVLADEPTGNLDRENARAVFALLRQLARDQGTSFLIATHDMELAAQTDRVVRMNAGVVTSG
ncbi:ABC transporter ATP-binding protein [Piscinibacterium candidicorallinum]|uniref:ABC transporter ATP-binding protein n=1 Tax=Piscinibacterium candidicorallinum TaxID=1793872 RepID=A0ABV7H227_9BURK